MRTPRLTAPALLVAFGAVAVAGTGIGAAVTTTPAYKACATKKNVLTLATPKGGCAKGSRAVKLNAQGPQGIQGPAGTPGVKGPKGDTGAKGDTGPAGNPNAVALTYREDTIADGWTTIGTLGNVSLEASCTDGGSGKATLAVRIQASVAVSATSAATEVQLAGTPTQQLYRVAASGGSPSSTILSVTGAPAIGFLGSGLATVQATVSGGPNLTAVLRANADVTKTATPVVCSVDGTLTQEPAPTA